MNEPEHSGPWYRHFWPWFIVLLIGSAMTASLATVWVAVANRDPMVRDDYYRQGMGINRRLEGRRLARDLGLQGELVLAPGGERLVLTLSGPRTAELGAVRLGLSHVTLAERDLSLRLERVGAGRFEAPLPASSAGLDGRWYATLEPVQAAADAGTPWRLEGSFRVPGPQPIRFGSGPAGAEAGEASEQQRDGGAAMTRTETGRS